MATANDAAASTPTCSRTQRGSDPQSSDWGPEHRTRVESRRHVYPKFRLCDGAVRIEAGKAAPVDVLSNLTAQQRRMVGLVDEGQ